MVSNAQRYLFLFLIGLAVGIVGTVMAMRAIDARQDHFPTSVMQVQQWHLGQLKANIQQNKCSANDTLPHLQALRAMAKAGTLKAANIEVVLTLGDHKGRC